MTLEELIAAAKVNGWNVVDEILYQLYEAQGAGTLVIGAGNNHIGQVGGNTALVQSTVNMTIGGSYAAGDYMGVTTTPLYFQSAVRTTLGTGVIKSITIADKILTANVAMELWIFSDTFAAPADNAAFSISDVEMLNVQAIIPISTTGWYANGSNQIYHDSTLAIPVKSNDGVALYYALVARGTTPSFASSDLTITLGILQD